MSQVTPTAAPLRTDSPSVQVDAPAPKGLRATVHAQTRPVVRTDVSTDVGSLRGAASAVRGAQNVGLALAAPAAGVQSLTGPTQPRLAAEPLEDQLVDVLDGRWLGGFTSGKRREFEKLLAKAAALPAPRRHALAAALEKRTSGYVSKSPFYLRAIEQFRKHEEGKREQAVIAFMLENLYRRPDYSVSERLGRVDSLLDQPKELEGLFADQMEALLVSTPAAQQAEFLAQLRATKRFDRVRETLGERRALLDELELTSRFNRPDYSVAQRMELVGRIRAGADGEDHNAEAKIRALVASTPAEQRGALVVALHEARAMGFVYGHLAVDGKSAAAELLLAHLFRRGDLSSQARVVRARELVEQDPILSDLFETQALALLESAPAVQRPEFLTQLRDAGLFDRVRTVLGQRAGTLDDLEVTARFARADIDPTTRVGLVRRVADDVHGDAHLGTAKIRAVVASAPAAQLDALTDALDAAALNAFVYEHLDAEGRAAHAVRLRRGLFDRADLDDAARIERLNGTVAQRGAIEALHADQIAALLSSSPTPVTLAEAMATYGGTGPSAIDVAHQVNESAANSFFDTHLFSRPHAPRARVAWMLNVVARSRAGSRPEHVDQIMTLVGATSEADHVAVADALASGEHLAPILKFARDQRVGELETFLLARARDVTDPAGAARALRTFGLSYDGMLSELAAIARARAAGVVGSVARALFEQGALSFMAFRYPARDVDSERDFDRLAARTRDTFAGHRADVARLLETLPPSAGRAHIAGAFEEAHSSEKLEASLARIERRMQSYVVYRSLRETFDDSDVGRHFAEVFDEAFDRDQTGEAIRRTFQRIETDYRAKVAVRDAFNQLVARFPRDEIGHHFRARFESGYDWRAQTVADVERAFRAQWDAHQAKVDVRESYERLVRRFPDDEIGEYFRGGFESSYDWQRQSSYDVDRAFREQWSGYEEKVAVRDTFHRLVKRFPRDELGQYYRERFEATYDWRDQSVRDVESAFRLELNTMQEKVALIEQFHRYVQRFGSDEVGDRYRKSFERAFDWERMDRSTLDQKFQRYWSDYQTEVERIRALEKEHATLLAAMTREGLPAPYLREFEEYYRDDRSISNVRRKADELRGRWKAKLRLLASLKEKLPVNGDWRNKLQEAFDAEPTMSDAKLRGIYEQLKKESERGNGGPGTGNGGPGRGGNGGPGGGNGGPGGGRGNGGPG